MLNVFTRNWKKERVGEKVIERFTKADQESKTVSIVIN